MGGRLFFKYLADAYFALSLIAIAMKRSRGRQ
jgi:hypothetical protein